MATLRLTAINRTRIRRFCMLLLLTFVAVATWRVGDPTPVAAQARTKVNPVDGLTYVWIPSGSFMMGWARSTYESGEPAHRVTLTRGFWMGQTPVTQAAYSKVMAHSPSWYKGDQWPVEHVGWSQAKAYCERVGMHLPTEAEWEYAARGGSTGDLYGNIDEIAWHSQNSGGTMHDVGQKLPNAYGLYDMLGNVREWVNDCFDWKYYQNSPSQDPPGPSTSPCNIRVIRGATWETRPSGVRVWDRGGGSARAAFNGSGFRCAGGGDSN
jgi:formylglycine-generating enzyme required for sulfatase activity